MIGFSYHGILSRILLAALHFNENAMRDQASTKEGKKRDTTSFIQNLKRRNILSEKLMLAAHMVT